MQLFLKFLKDGTYDRSIMERLKLIIRCNNLNEVDPHGIADKLKVNAKPILIRKTSHFWKGENYLEVDIDFHRWSYLNLNLCHKYVKPQMHNGNLDIGFTIEGVSDEELPERMFGCVRLFGLNIDSLPSFAEQQDVSDAQHSTADPMNATRVEGQEDCQQAAQMVEAALPEVQRLEEQGQHLMASELMAKKLEEVQSTWHFNHVATAARAVSKLRGASKTKHKPDTNAAHPVK